MKELCMFSLRLWFACRSFSPVISHVRTPAYTYFAVLGRFPTPFQVGGSIWLRRFDTVEVWGSSPHGPTIPCFLVWPSFTSCRVKPPADFPLDQQTIWNGELVNTSVGTAWLRAAYQDLLPALSSEMRRGRTRGGWCSGRFSRLVLRSRRKCCTRRSPGRWRLDLLFRAPAR